MCTSGTEHRTPSTPAITQTCPPANQHNKLKTYTRTLAILGPHHSGKSSLLIRFALNKFPTIYTPELYESSHAPYLPVLIKQSEKKKQEEVLVKLHYHDTIPEAYASHGQSLPFLHYPRADVVVLCFDNPTLVEEAVREEWMARIRENYPKGQRVVVVGTKVDLRDEEEKGDQFRCVTRADGEVWARRMGVVDYMECSAKTGEGVTEVFERAAVEAVQVYDGESGPGVEGLAVEETLVVEEMTMSDQ